MSKIVMTGGGSVGHVVVNTVLIPKLIDKNWEVKYIGSKNGPEESMIKSLDNITYYGISTGKLRRYISMENIKDIFKIIKGTMESFRIIKREKPNIIFSCGGFVSVPVVLAGWLNRVPIIVRETDYNVGLANKISIPLAKYVAVTFSDTLKEMSSNKRFECGPIIREELMCGDRDAGFKFAKITDNKPVIFVIGGSQGAKAINETIRDSLNNLIDDFNIVHICGKGKKDNEIEKDGYVQFEYIDKELPDIYAIADIVVGRAGSNSVFENVLLKKPMLLIPISKKASRGDQILNAKYIENSGFGKVLLQEDLNKDSLVLEINNIYINRESFIINLINAGKENGVQNQLDLIYKLYSEQ